MQDNTSDPLNLNKRQRHNVQYGVPPPSDGGIWDQLHENMKAEQQ